MDILRAISVANHIDENYKIISFKPEEDDIYARPLGEGGSGIVYLSEQSFIESIKVKRAIKFFVYRDDIADMTVHEFSGRISSKNFNDEILNISSFNHENIIKIIELFINPFFYL